MARVHLSAIITSISGRYGGGVFRNWKGIPVLSVLPESVANPRTAPQVAAREVLSVCSKAWSALSWTVKDQWSSVADYLSNLWEHYDNEIGSDNVITPPRGPFTGLDALTSTHALLYSIGAWTSADALEDAPVGVSNPTVPLDLALSGDTSGLVVTWTDPADWGDNAHPGAVRVWIQSEDGTFFTQLAAYESSGTETTTITAARSSGGGGSIALRPGPYFVQADAVNEEGLRSAPSAVARISLANPV